MPLVATELVRTDAADIFDAVLGESRDRRWSAACRSRRSPQGNSGCASWPRWTSTRSIIGTGQ
ncbi:MAG: hypothetical protein QOJ46_1976 [bacterium]|jgi:hypothetical protein